MYRAGVFNHTNYDLMQTEFSSMIAMFEKNYQLIYSERYTGNLRHCDSIIEGCQYSMPIDRAFESLLSQNYSFILTIAVITVEPADKISFVHNCMPIQWEMTH